MKKFEDILPEYSKYTPRHTCDAPGGIMPAVIKIAKKEHYCQKCGRLTDRIVLLTLVIQRCTVACFVTLTELSSGPFSTWAQGRAQKPPDSALSASQVCLGVYLLYSGSISSNFFIIRTYSRPLVQARFLHIVTKCKKNLASIYLYKV